MNEATMMMCGNLVDAPTLRRTKGGHCVANFRIASTPRRYDREQGAWVDGDTLFVTVTAWRALAENVADSLRKGEPVVVVGRYCQHEYTQNDVVRTAYELEATAIGPDLSRGVTSFVRRARSVGVRVDLDADGIPADQTAHYLEIEDAATGGTGGTGGTGDGREADHVTGEVLEPVGAA